MRVLLPFFLAAAAAFAQKSPGFDPGALNRAIDPCVNFYQFACGGWMTANPMPGDQSRWGRFDLLQENNRTILQNLLESASPPRATRAPLEQKIGDYYAACMDEKTVNAKGLGPLKPELDAISGIKTRAEIAGVVARMFRMGYNPFFRFGSEQDAKDSTQVNAGLDQGGLGLPDRDYYLNTDEKSVDLRNKYQAMLSKVFEFAGSPSAEAAKKAAAVMDIETELAKG